MQQCLCTDYKNFDAVKRLEGRKGRKYFIIGQRVFHVFQFRVRFPAALQKSLGGDAMRGIKIKIFLGFLASKCRTAFSGENRSKAFEMVVTVWTSF